MTERTCDIADCEGRVVARGYCRKHYTRWYRNGDPLFNAYASRQRPEDERFWANVDKRGPDDCWPWLGHISPRGYGRCRHSAGRLAPRVAFYLTHGYLPDTADHDCHNRDADCPGGDSDPHRRCCNPGHIVDRAPADNSAEALRTRRYCKNGHEVSDTGERWGNFRCRQCYEDSQARKLVKQREKRSGGPGRGRKPTEACAKGHPWVEGSFRVYGKAKSRSCNECKRVRAHERWLRIKAEREAAR